MEFFKPEWTLVKQNWVEGCAFLYDHAEIKREQEIITTSTKFHTFFACRLHYCASQLKKMEVVIATSLYTESALLFDGYER